LKDYVSDFDRESRRILEREERAGENLATDLRGLTRTDDEVKDE